MASIQKINYKSGTAYLLAYYINNKKFTKYFPPKTPYYLVEAEKKRIESEVALHNAGLKKMVPEGRPTKLNLAEFTGMIIWKLQTASGRWGFSTILREDMKMLKLCLKTLWKFWKMPMDLIIKIWRGI